MEPEFTEAAVHAAGVLPEFHHAPLLFLHDLKRFEHAAGHRGGGRGGENEATGFVADEFDHVLVPGEEPTHAAERFGKGAHHEVGPVGCSRMVGAALAAFAHHPEGVGFVDVEFGSEFAGHVHQLGQTRDIARHAENAVDDHHLAGFGGEAGKTTTQGFRGIVGKGNDFGRRHAAAVNDAGVVFLVAKNEVAVLEQGGQGPLVGKISGGKEQGGIFSDVVGQGLLKLLMDDEVAAEETRPGAAQAVFAGGFDRGFDHTGIVGQAEVVVRPDHEDALALADDFGAVHFLDRAEKGINAEGLGPLGLVVSHALGKEVVLSVPRMAIEGRCRFLLVDADDFHQICAERKN